MEAAHVAALQHPTWRWQAHESWPCSQQAALLSFCQLLCQHRAAPQHHTAPPHHDCPGQATPMAPRPAAKPPHAGGSGKSADERWAAVHSLRMAGAQRLSPSRLSAALPLFQDMAPTSTIAKGGGKWKSFASLWFNRVRAGKGVEDAKRSGRPPKVTNSEALTIATKLTQGTVGRGSTKRPYCSMEEVSCGAQHSTAGDCRCCARPACPRRCC